MAKSLLFATNNKHKLEEIKAIVGDFLNILSLADVGFDDDIPETSSTIAGNAIQKANFLSKRYEMAVFADDTGLEVEALGGAPGVFSARYAGPNATYEQNVEKLLRALDGIENRNARFVTVIALIEPGKRTMLFEGIVNGMITNTIRGAGGFGYDPVFQPLGFDLTYAEMPNQQKNDVSHRALAVRKLLQYLKENISHFS